MNNITFYNGHMTTNGRSNKGRIDWPVIEKWVVTTPRATLADAAERFEVSERSVQRHGNGKAGCWIEQQIKRCRALSIKADERMAEILAQDRADDMTAFRQLEFRLQKVVLKSLELLFPPAEAPIEAHVEAEARLKALTARELSSVINEGLRTLTETGRHRRLLAGKSTAIFARADSPDVYIPEDIDHAQEIERRARRAQQALVAAAEKEYIDIEGKVIPPDPPSSAHSA